MIVAGKDESSMLVFESERLLFRPLDHGDLALSLALWTDPEITKYVGGAQDKQTLISEHTKYMRRCAGGCIGVWTLTTLGSGEQIGTAILLPMPIEEIDTDWDLVVGEELPDCDIEVGYILKKSAWGMGYATEACLRLVQFGFENTDLQAIVATTDFDNLASQNVLKKSGFIFEGVRRSYAEDCPGFRITRSQWEGSS
ncbi:MAG: GNAT family protein [Pseudomonadota bacterium]